MTPASTIPERASGVLMHVSSLPRGRIDDDAYRFVDWLADAGQRWWQVLPLNPRDHTGSPYNSPSAFAADTGYLAAPRARVTAAEREEFAASHAYWAADWAEFAGGTAAIDAQVRFAREWTALRAYAGAKGISLIGDVPIFVADGGVDHRRRPHLFQRDSVAGVPPDAFSATGQLWGNPLYDWPRMRADRYRWWIERLRRAIQLTDVVRIDHFRGFVAYWSVRRGERTAQRGRWRRGPGIALFRAFDRELGRVPIIAEDLGDIRAAVRRLRDTLGLPGMRVLQFGLTASADNEHRVEQHPENCVAYTGTHDNDTAVGWWSSLDDAQQRATGLDAHEAHWQLIRMLFASRARLAIVPLQDVLGLGSEARMNLPGASGQSWRWRVRGAQLTGELAARLREETVRAGR